MAKRKVLRHKVTGAIFGWNPAMAKNPKVEEVELDLSEPQSKPDDEPSPPSKKKASKKKAAKAPTTPLVADSEEELDKLLEGIETDGKDG
jgi:hypothetical protein